MMIEVGALINNRYEILEKIGEGGSAVVYKARCHILNRFVAVKVLKDEFSSDAEFVEKFKKEAYAAASFSDNNIVNIYDIGTDGNINYIIQEFVDGKTLKQIINENGRLDYKDAVDKCRQIASALVCAHKNNIIHRDIKPHNILVTKDGVLKVADFGIAKATDSVTITSTDKVMGSAHYISPEQAKGIYVDAKTDIYSLGIVLYEMLVGKVPFDGETPVAVALKHIQESPVPPIEVNSEIPMALNNIVLKAIAKEPYKRYGSAKELIYALDDFENGVKDEGNTSIEDDFTRVMNPIDETAFFDPNEINKIKPASKANAQNKNLEEDEIDRADDEDIMPRRQREKKNNVGKGKKVIISVVLALIVLAAIGAVAYIAETKGLKNVAATTKVSVPNIVNMQQAAAKKLVESDGLKFTVAETKPSDKAKGTVLESFPSAGTSVNSGSEVRVNISAGPDQKTVPTIEGLDLATAKQQITDAGLTVGTITNQSSDSVPSGNIISQSLSDGANVDPGTADNLVVSTGPQIKMVTVPGVVGYSKNDAISSIKAAGLAYNVTYTQTTDNTQDGKVAAQDLTSGSSVKQGSTVTITVYKYVNNTANVPSVVGESQASATAALQQAGFTVSVASATSAPTSASQSNTVASQSANGNQTKGSTVTIYVYGTYQPSNANSGNGNGSGSNGNNTSNNVTNKVN